ncbi:MAG: alpha/beta hydrolase [Actinomycetota bacterium]|nr:alpha/beta hydrolase [Actinomycetota bacterium]
MLVIRRILGLLGLSWVVWRLFGPDVQPTYDGAQVRPIHVPGRTVFVGEHEFFVREAGDEDAPPLVLIHGWSFDGEMNFFQIIPALSKHFRVIVPDHRNHGKSDRIRGSFEIDDLATDVIGVLDELGYVDVDLFGFSMGGMASQVIAHRHPERVRRLILAGTAAFPIDRHRSASLVAFWLARALARFSKKEAASFTFRFLRRSRVIESGHERWMWAALMNRDPSLFYESANAAWRFDSRSWVDEIEHPTMVIIPTADQVVPARTQYDLAGRIDGSEIVEIPNVGHESILSRPEAYVEAIEGFLGA